MSSVRGPSLELFRLPLSEPAFPPCEPTARHGTGSFENEVVETCVKVNTTNVMKPICLHNELGNITVPMKAV